MRNIKKIISAALAFVMLTSGFGVLSANAPSGWAADDVNAAIAAGLVPSGLQSNYTQAATRAEFSALAVALYELVSGVIAGRVNFSDTSDVNVEKAAYIGVVLGMGDGTFNPGANLTREQAAVMLARLANAIGQPFAASAATFADNAQIADWAIESVGAVQVAGIMGGVGDNMFAPSGDYTREQSIVTIMRVFNALNGAGPVPTPAPTPVPTPEPTPAVAGNPNDALFPDTPSYVFDFSDLTQDALSTRRTVTRDSLISTMPGAVLTIAPAAAQQNFDMRVTGHANGLRASGSPANSFIDPNGAGRNLVSTVQLTGPVRVVITGRTTTGGSRAYVPVTFAMQTVNQFVNDTTSLFESVTFDFNGNGTVAINDWPWQTDDPGRGRLGIQRIEIFEGTGTVVPFTPPTATPPPTPTPLPTPVPTPIPDAVRMSADNQFPFVANETLSWQHNFQRVILRSGVAQMYINDHLRDVDAALAVPFTRNDVLFVPYDAAVRALGTAVTWSVAGNNVTASAGGRNHTAAGERVNDVLFVPLSTISTGIGHGSVGWDTRSGTLIVTTGVTVSQAASTHVGAFAQPDAWFGSQESIRIANNFDIWQRNSGGWISGTDFAAAITPEREQQLITQKTRNDATFDNNATLREIRFMFRAYDATRIQRFHDAAMLGLNAVLDAQYPNGGIPQFIVDRSGYRGHITINDNTMINVVNFLNDIARNPQNFPSIDAATVARCRDAVERATNLLLDLQIFSEQQQMLTAWAAQYHPVTLEPAWARDYEPPSISASESIGVLRFLMEIPNPDERVQNAVDSAVAFFAHVEITGYRRNTGGGDRTLERISGQRNLWARFICIDTFNPLIYDRRSPNWREGENRDRPGELRPGGGIYRNIYRADGSMDLVASYANLSHERRNGYAYFGNWPNVLPNLHANWRR